LPLSFVSAKDAVKILKHNVAKVDEEKAEVILDFLYLIAKTYRRAGECNDLLDVDRGVGFEH